MRISKKLIEAALPLDAINRAAAREKSIRHGHPSTLHLWWARRPLAAARAVVFAQMVDDPSEYVDVLLSDPARKRRAARELKRRLAEHEAKQTQADAEAVAEPAPTLEAVAAERERERPDLAPYKGRELTVIAWLWARTVRSPNPAFAEVEVPLVSTFLLSTKKGKEAYVEPVVEGGGYRFAVKVGVPGDVEAAKRGTKLARGANFRCVMSGTPMSGDYIKVEGTAGRMGARLMAIVAEGDRGRVYLAPTVEHEHTAGQAQPRWAPEGDVPARLTGGTCVPYGLTVWGDLFTPRQLVALTTFSDLIGEAVERVRRDAVAAGLPDDGIPLRDGGAGATAYAEAVAVYLGFTISKLSDRGSTICTWFTERDSTPCLLREIVNVETREGLQCLQECSLPPPLVGGSRNPGGEVANPDQLLLAPEQVLGQTRQVEPVVPLPTFRSQTKIEIDPST